tara:strand:+ start:1819 stop:3108 length:1290 start_codon:yes stop_codon:yes gene_type:complete
MNRISLYLCFLVSVSVTSFSDVERADNATLILFAIKGEEIIGHGSGFFVTKDGYIITNQHVISSGERFIAAGKLYDFFEINLVWSSKAKDLAILKANPSSHVSYLQIWGEKLKKGEEVFALGFPGTQLNNYDIFGVSEGDRNLDSTITRGILSRQFSGQGGAREYIQHTAEIRMGNSGGPLLNECGIVIGVNTLITAAEEKDMFALASAELIDALMGRIRGVEIVDSCSSDVTATNTQKAEQLSENSNRGIEKKLENDATVYIENISVQDWKNIAVLSVVTALFLILLSRKNSHTISPPNLSSAHRIDEITDNPIKPIKRDPSNNDYSLSGFDQNGRPINITLSLHSLSSPFGIFVGRNTQFAAFQIPFSKISRVHCKFSLVNGDLHLEDCNSTNGTRVNGAPQAPFVLTRLHVGDEITLAEKIKLVLN